MSSGHGTLIFLHLPKTGGTSLRATLIDSISPRPSIKLMNHDHTPLLAMKREERAALGLVEGHMLYGVHEHLPGPYSYITLLREPVARLRSWHRYVLQTPRHRFHGVVAQGGLSLGDCVSRRMTPELDNDMTRTLASVGREGTPFGAVTRQMFEVACERLSSIQFIGTTERLGEFHAMLCDRMGWQAHPVKHLNRTTTEITGVAADIRASPSDDAEGSDAAQMIREVNRFDHALWEQAAVILDHDLAECRQGI
ncbi:MAG: sulfotransferase family 2 domain-containing protein [Phycisphaeraceae bacterium]|nr:MAG: sulfotransferase family 2 domain-containing protein [Phycisphaeraceae bacterium]